MRVVGREGPPRRPSHATAHSQGVMVIAEAGGGCSSTRAAVLLLRREDLTREPNKQKRQQHHSGAKLHARHCAPVQCCTSEGRMRSSGAVSVLLLALAHEHHEDRHTTHHAAHMPGGESRANARSGTQWRGERGRDYKDGTGGNGGVGGGRKRGFKWEEKRARE